MNLRTIAVLGLTAPLLSLSACKSEPRSQPVASINARADSSFLEAYGATFRFRLGNPSSVHVAPDGESVLFLRSGPRDWSQDLFIHDPRTGEERVLLSAAALLGGAEEELTPEELARRERTRTAARGITGYRMDKDERRLLVPLSGDLYVVDLESLAQTRLATSEDSGLSAPIDPRFSPDGSMIACARDGDLFVIDVESSAQTRLTNTASEIITNAEAEFVAQEEMRRREGYWWSPDSRFIAYQENDESDVEWLSIMDPKDPGKAPRSWRYPRAGTTNATVRLGVVPASGGDTVWVQWDNDRYPYLATVKWADDAPLTVVVQNREQTELQVIAVDHVTGETTTLLTERDDAWLRLNQRVPHWIDDGAGFLWLTERNGGWQLERRSRSGDLIMALNAPDAGLLGLLHVDEDERRVFVSASNSPTERHLGVVPLDGPTQSLVQLVTQRPGVHSFEFSNESDLLVHTSSGPESPTRRVVRQLDGDSLGPVLSELRSVREDPGFTPRPEFVKTSTEPGFHAVVVRPRGFLPGQRYPVILHVYGGPTSQMVTASRDRYLLQQWIADNGYIVVAIDGRGTPGRGRDWLRTTRGNFIDAPLDDQVAGLQDLAIRYPEMDLSRVGVFGWSFGGYFSAMATMRRPDIFDAGVAGAPVTDWKDYDTHYTERYLGVPPAADRAYEVSNVLTYADQLRQPLLIIHGTADDNVYLVHSLKMSDALFRAGIDHEFLPLSGFTHMVTEPQVTQRMYERIMSFFEENVKLR